MATKKFMREPKEMTTEPSADEVGSGMKRGGHAHKKHMAMGGMGMPMRRPAMTPMLMKRKEGGKAEKAEMHELHKLEKELKHHEHMKAKKAHHGLKMGGKAAYAKDNTPGGLLGGIEATRHDPKHDTGGVRKPGYKHGGKTHHKHHMADGGLAAKGDRFQTEGTLKPKINVKDKVVEAKQVKGFSTKTGKVRNTVAGEKDAGFKKGGHAKHHYAKGGTVSDNVANRYKNTMMHDGVHSPMEKHSHKTGEIKQKPAGYKKGGHVKHEHGHVAHHTTHGHGDHGHAHMHKHVAKHHHGHDKIDGHPMKHGGHAHKHHTKISTHKKAGGSCNY
jgi:hypothetical protein